MRLRSTRSGTRDVSLEEAILHGLAPDGGLYQPLELPALAERELESLRGMGFRDVAQVVSRRLFQGSPGAERLERAAGEALDFEVPIVDVAPGTRVVELFHGPTGSFKDTGARFLSRVLAALEPATERPILVVVATSGDTGGAVAHALQEGSRVRGVVLYPEGRVSPVQYRQIVSAASGRKGVRAVEVAGSFDDCQRLVKEALSDPDLRRLGTLTSANSINAARLLPQAFHYFHLWSHLHTRPSELVISVPTGNLGHLVAGVLAVRMGLSETRLVAATNANDGLVRYLAGEALPDRESLETLSSAMDVAKPSNLERLVDLFGHDLARLRSRVQARSYSDEETLAAMARVYEEHGYLADPHTAVGWLALDDVLPPDQRSRGRVGAVFATAHPAKFPDAVHRATGVRPDPPATWRDEGSPASAGAADPEPLRIPPRMQSLRPVVEQLLEP